MIPSTLKKKIRLFEKGAKEGKKRKKKKEQPSVVASIALQQPQGPELTRVGEIGFPPPHRRPVHRRSSLCVWRWLEGSYPLLWGGMASVSLLVWTWPGGTLIAVPASSLMALFPAVECHHLIAKVRTPTYASA